MNLLHPGKDIGAGHAHFRQPRSICATADRHRHRLQPLGPAGGAGQLYRRHVLFQPVAHVAVLRLDATGHHGARFGGLHGSAGRAQQITLCRQPFQLEIAQDESQLCLGGGAGQFIDMQKSVAAIDHLGRLCGQRQAVQHLGRQMQRIHQLALGIAGMGRNPSDLHHRAISRKALELDLAHLATIQRIGEIGAQIGGQARIDAAPHLFIRGKGNANGPMRDLRVFQQVPRQRHDDRHPGLVIAAQQRGAARGDDVMPQTAGQIGRIFGGQRQFRRIGKADRAAVIAAMHDGLHPGGVEGRRGIHMRQQPQHRRRDPRRCGDGGQHHAIIRQLHIRRPDLLQLGQQQALQIQLDRGAGLAVRPFIALRIHRRIADQALFQFAVECGSHRGLLRCLRMVAASRGRVQWPEWKNAPPLRVTRLACWLTGGGQFAMASCFGSLKVQTVPPWFR